MIYEVDADLLAFPDIDAFVHQANCFHTMGAGIAKQIKEKYPEMYKADIAHGRSGDMTRLGKFSWAKCHDGKIGYNLYSQYNFGGWKRNTNYEAVANGLTAVVNHAIVQGVTRLGLPKNMGCTLGGGSWPVVRAIIDSVVAEFTIDVYICNYPK